MRIKYARSAEKKDACEEVGKKALTLSQNHGGDRACYRGPVYHQRDIRGDAPDTQQYLN